MSVVHDLPGRQVNTRLRWRCVPRAALIGLAMCAPVFAADVHASTAAPTLDFAESLFQGGQYREAAVEFLRYSLDGPSDDDGRQQAVLRAANSYRRGGSTDVALRCLDSFTSRTVLADSFRCLARLERSYCLRDRGEHEQAFAALQGSGCGPGTPAAPRMALMSAGELLHLRRWKEATEAVTAGAMAGSDSAASESIARLQALAGQGRRMRGPSPAVAGALSTVIPGAGRIYAGRRAEGVSAFLMTGAAIWQSVAGFRDRGRASLRGWISGSMGLVLYTGGIYGSCSAASQAQASAWRDFAREVDQTVEAGQAP